MRILIPALLFAVLGGAPARGSDPAPGALAALSACRSLADDRARLACFDRETASLVQSVERRETLVLDRDEVNRTRRSLFGFTSPKGPLFPSDDKAAEPEFTQIEAPIQTVRSTGYGRFRFSLEDGAEWQTTEGINAFPKPGQKVLIRKGMMGSYFIRFEGARAVKGMRVG